MENNTALKNKTGAFEKARLIHEALESLRAADRIDERDDLNEASWTDWYDHTIPEVRDIKILAGAMEVELARRHGEKIEIEGYHHGGDRTSSVQLDTCLSNAAKIQRSRDHAIASRPDDDAKIHTCTNHRAIAYEGDNCPVCELIERGGVLARHVKKLEREIEELREREIP